jgi:hypothetical protein
MTASLYVYQWPAASVEKRLERYDNPEKRAIDVEFIERTRWDFIIVEGREIQC